MILIITSIILAFFITQTIKLFVNYNKTGEIQFSSYLQNGGMPSSHTASTVALTTCLLMETGLSYITITAALFTIIVMNDAMKVRRETGEEAEVLNQVIAKENIAHRRLTERVGHTPLQVTIGALLGVLIPLILYAL